MSFDRVEELAGNEARQDGRGGATQPVGQHERAARVDQARSVQHHVVAIRIEQVGENVGHDRRIRALRVPDELQLPRRAARREQQQRRVGGDRHQGILGGRARRLVEQIVELEPVGVEAGVAVGDDEPGAGGAQDRLLLGLREPWVQRHAGDAGLHAGEVERDRMQSVPDQEPDLLDPALEEHVGDAVREGIDVGECQGLVAAEHRRAAAEAARAAADQLGGRHGAIIPRRPPQGVRRTDL